MDPLAAVLSGQRASDAFVIRSDLTAPWSIRLEDRSALTAVVVVRGGGVLLVDGREPVALAEGDVALVQGRADYTLADHRTTRPQARIGPDQGCTKPDGSPLSDFRDLGQLAWGNVADGEDPETVLLTASYRRAHQVSRQLLEQLPVEMVLPATRAPASVSVLTALLAEEMHAGRPALGVVADRLVDLLTLAVLRTWCEQSSDPVRWHPAHHGPVVGAALRRLHHEPQRPWTLAALAAEVGVSRATLARRFAHDLGEPVMTYLARHRVDTAAELLATTDLTVEAVAARVGYGTSFSLSSAFKRHRGCSPTAFRRSA